jgi:UDP-N-acetylglucosamine--N-acetylmuramyl-(pentapeptide) pyrophosphoryl-undecaprenol N-acetylglucosamine transferase
MAAGGTGGHVMPALAVARSIKEMDPGARILFLGTGREAEDRILEPEGWERQNLSLSGLKGQGPLGLVKAMARLARAIGASKRILRDYRAQAVFGTGAYLSGAVGYAAYRLKIFLAIHEQNARPGLANRWLGKKAQLVFLAQEQARAFFPAGRSRQVGCPVREEIARLGEDVEGLLSSRLSGQSQERPAILVTGGSQGARNLNRAVFQMARIIARKGLAWRIWHQTGPGDLEEARALYRELSPGFLAGAFFGDMEAKLQEASLAITRAGALTLAELQAAALPSILVPLPWAADDHQRANAKAMEDEGAAKVLEESGLSGESLFGEAKAILGSRDRQESLSRAARGKFQPGADKLMARQILESLARA